MTLIDDEKALWYLTRSTGLVALVLLTAALVLGMVTTIPSSSTAWPRFVTQLLHRNVAVLAVVLVAVHAVTSVTEGFVPLTVVDIVVPFGAAYRPVEIGLGALSVDLLIALVATSAVRRRLGFRSWRTVHYAAYAAWPLAAVHGIRTGSDMSSAPVRWLVIGCITAVVVAAVARLTGATSAATGVPAR